MINDAFISCSVAHLCSIFRYFQSCKRGQKGGRGEMLRAELVTGSVCVLFDNNVPCTDKSNDQNHPPSKPAARKKPWWGHQVAYFHGEHTVSIGCSPQIVADITLL